MKMWIFLLLGFFFFLCSSQISFLSRLCPYYILPSQQQPLSNYLNISMRLPRTPQILLVVWCSPTTYYHLLNLYASTSLQPQS